MSTTSGNVPVPPGQALRFPDHEATVPAFLASVVERYGDRQLASLGGHRLTYADLERASARLAQGLLGAGVVKGTHVALLFPSSPAFLVQWFAVTRIGAVAVLLNTFSKPRELGFALARADVSHVHTVDRFLGHDYLGQLETCVEGLATVTRTGARTAPDVWSASHPFLRRIRVWGASIPGWATDGRDIDGSGPDVGVSDAILAAAQATVTPADPCVIIFSSGSTSEPKAVVHSQGTAIRHSHNLHPYFELDGDDVLYASLPLFWVGGLSHTMINAMHVGARLVFDERFDPGPTLDLIEREGVTQVISWPDLAKRLTEHPTYWERSLSLRRGIADLLPSELRPANPELIPGSLGMSETFGPHLAAGHDELPPDKQGSFGQSIPGMEHRIVDPDTGKPLGPGEHGEICVRGYSLMLGLYGRERSDVFDADGWYHTGDGGWYDRDGHVFFTGRLGDAIKTKGANVSPARGGAGGHGRRRHLDDRRGRAPSPRSGPGCRRRGRRPAGPGGGSRPSGRAPSCAADRGVVLVQGAAIRGRVERGGPALARQRQARPQAAGRGAGRPVPGSLKVRHPSSVVRGDGHGSNSLTAVGGRAQPDARVVTVSTNPSAASSAPVSDAELVERFAHLRVDRDNASFYRGLLDHELRMHRCAECGLWHQPPRPMCPRCWSWDVVSTPVSGRGTVHLLMRLHQGPTAPNVDYADGPYPVVTVELEEQPPPALHQHGRQLRPGRDRTSACPSPSPGSTATARPSPCSSRRSMISMTRNPIKDQIAFVGVGTTGFSRTSDRTSLALALDASTRAIRDAGLTAADIDGVVATAEPGAPGPEALATALGLTDVTHFSKPTPVVMNSIVDAMNAVFAGLCDTVLVCTAMAPPAVELPQRRQRSLPPAPRLPAGEGHPRDHRHGAGVHGVGQPIHPRVRRHQGTVRPHRGQHAHERDPQPAGGHARPDHPGRLRRRLA